MTSDCDTLLLSVAFTFVKGAKVELLRAMDSLGMSLEEFFSLPDRELLPRLGLKSADAFTHMDRDEALVRARKEMEFTSRHNIKVLAIGSDDYPWRLIDISDPPIVLYKLGEGDIDSDHSVSIVGTRRPTPQGAAFARQLTLDLGGYFPDLNVVSGLAFGIDSCAHSAALEAGVTTTAVVAHGLDMIYPAAHRQLAASIVKSGGCILSEYPSGVRPFKGHFLERNRIVATLPQATVVVESAARGGAMSTANTAFSYSRDVCAVPGRVGDPQSEGCNLLIRKNKAQLITSAADLIEITGWEPLGVKIDARQRNLFPDLDGDQKLIYDFLRYEKDPVTLDTLHQRLQGLPMQKIMAALGEMEFDGVVARHPGNRFSII